MKRVLHIFGDAIGPIDRGHPLGHLPEHAPIVDLLKGLSIQAVGADLPDEQDHRGRVLKCGVYADRCVGCAWPAGHEGDARLAGQLAPGLGHVRCAPFLTADHQRQSIAHVIQGIKHREKALARHAESPARAVHAELIDQDLPAGARPRHRAVVA